MAECHLLWWERLGAALQEWTEWISSWEGFEKNKFSAHVPLRHSEQIVMPPPTSFSSEM